MLSEKTCAFLSLNDNLPTVDNSNGFRERSVVRLASEIVSIAFIQIPKHMTYSDESEAADYFQNECKTTLKFLFPHIQREIDDKVIFPYFYKDTNSINELMSTIVPSSMPITQFHQSVEFPRFPRYVVKPTIYQKLFNLFVLKDTTTMRINARVLASTNPGFAMYIFYNSLLFNDDLRQHFLELLVCSLSHWRYSGHLTGLSETTEFWHSTYSIKACDNILSIIQRTPVIFEHFIIDCIILESSSRSKDLAKQIINLLMTASTRTGRGLVLDSLISCQKMIDRQEMVVNDDILDITTYCICRYDFVSNEIRLNDYVTTLYDSIKRFVRVILQDPKHALYGSLYSMAFNNSCLGFNECDLCLIKDIRLECLDSASISNGEIAVKNCRFYMLKESYMIKRIILNYHISKDSIRNPKYVNIYHNDSILSSSIFLNNSPIKWALEGTLYLSSQSNCKEVVFKRPLFCRNLKFEFVVDTSKFADHFYCLTCEKFFISSDRCCPTCQTTSLFCPKCSLEKHPFHSKASFSAMCKFR
ncbi:hypothetical protein GJ496_004898 [Pomphorhynchus laevis]|nr:hypothetical protein GJ496_004898 [Pomphorhynchus laevis]